jgi:hypothetical protein
MVSGVPTITDWVQAMSTFFLVAFTVWVERERRRLERERRTPYLVWQSPTAGLATDGSTVRIQIDVVLWNQGGPARIAWHSASEGDSGERYEIDHFDDGSMIPAPQQLVLHVFRDVPRAQYTPRIRDIGLYVHYEDYLTGDLYETIVSVSGVYGNLMAPVPSNRLTLRPIPSLIELGATMYSAAWFLSDSKTPAERWRRKTRSWERDALPGRTANVSPPGMRWTDREAVISYAALVTLFLIAVMRVDLSVGVTAALLVTFGVAGVVVGLLLSRGPLGLWKRPWH